MSIFQADVLQGRVALITGGGTGICKGIASAFARHGARLCITSRKQEVLDSTAAGYANLDPRQYHGSAYGMAAVPGENASRHHWGTDLDVYDSRAVGEDYQVQLSPAEVAPGGPGSDAFTPLAWWGHRTSRIRLGTSIVPTKTTSQ